MFKLKLKKKPKVSTAGLDRKVFDIEFLNKVGRVVRDAIVYEAKRQAAMDLKKSEGYRPFLAETEQFTVSELVPEGIPRSPKFFDSFKWRIVNGTKLEVYSTWPWIRQVVDGRDPYKMTWLTKSAGVDTVPFTDPMGKVVFRSTPQNDADAWVHPGFAKHTFVEKGWERARPTVRRMYALQTVKKGLKKALGG
jgi:hypothetical protein